MVGPESARTDAIESPDALRQEVARRRKVAVTMVGLLVPLTLFRMPGLARTTERRAVLCDQTVTMPDADGNLITSNLRLPCEWRDVTETAWWGWPLAIATASLIVVGGLTLWAMMPRITVLPLAPAMVEPFVGRRTRRGVKYRISRFSLYVAVLGGTPFLVGGLLLLVLPSGAPWPISVGFMAIGLLILSMWNVSAAVATLEHLRVRPMFMWKSWKWSEVTHVGAVEGFGGPAKMRRRMLEVRTAAGAFTHESLSSMPTKRGASRADRLAAALEIHRSQARDGAGDGPP